MIKWYIKINSLIINTWINQPSITTLQDGPADGGGGEWPIQSDVIYQLKWRMAAECKRLFQFFVEERRRWLADSAATAAGAAAAAAAVETAVEAAVEASVEASVEGAVERSVGKRPGARHDATGAVWWIQRRPLEDQVDVVGIFSPFHQHLHRLTKIKTRQFDW